MKETFDKESKIALINYRTERAYETLNEAQYNADGVQQCRRIRFFM